MDGKILVRNGVQETEFVKEIANKGYTEGSRQLDQVVDLELYLHKAKINRRWHLCVQRGKHRGQEIISEDDLYFVLPFPNQAPIKEDVNDNNTETSNGENLEEEIFSTM